MTRLPDPDRSHAVLVGNAHYDSSAIEDRPEILANVRELQSVLCDPALSVFDESNCHIIPDGQLADVYSQMKKWSRAAEDTFFVYWCGHGRLDNDLKLRLLVRNSALDVLPVSTLGEEDLKGVFAQSFARIKLLILDACFSGRTIRRTLKAATASFSARLEGSGAYIMTSVPPNEEALAARPGEPMTPFTGELVRVMRGGVDDAPALLNCDTVFREVRRNLVSRNLPEPDQQIDGTASDIALVRNLMADQREDEAIAVSPDQAAAITRTSRLRAGITLNRRRFIAGGVAAIVSAAGIALLAEELTGSPQPLPASPFPALPAFSFRAKANVADAVFDRTGSYLAWGGDDTTVTLWDPGGSTAPAELPHHHTDSIHGLAFQPDGEVLASCDNLGAIWLWNPARRQPIRPLAGPTSTEHALWSIAFGRAGKLISGGQDGKVILWDVNAPPSQGFLIDDLGAVIRAVAAGPGGIFAAGSDKGEIRFWNQDGQSVHQPTRNLGVIRSIAFSPSGSVAVGSDTSDIYLFDPGSPTPAAYRDHRDGVYALDFDPQNPQRFASGGYDGILRLSGVPQKCLELVTRKRAPAWRNAKAPSDWACH